MFILECEHTEGLESEIFPSPSTKNDIHICDGAKGDQDSADKVSFHFFDNQWVLTSGGGV